MFFCLSKSISQSLLTYLLTYQAIKCILSTKKLWFSEIILCFNFRSNGLIFGSVISGLAMGGILGLIELITNTGGLLKRRSDVVVPNFFRRKDKRPKRPESVYRPQGSTYNTKKKKPYKLLEDLKEYEEDYEYYYYEYEENPEDKLVQNKTTTTTPSPPRKYQNTIERYPSYSTKYQAPPTSKYHTKPYPTSNQYPADNSYQYNSQGYQNSQSQYPSRPTFQYPSSQSQYSQSPHYLQPSNHHYQGYQYSQAQYPSISKKIGVADNAIYQDLHNQYPHQTNTLLLPDIYTRVYENQVYASPPSVKPYLPQSPENSHPNSPPPPSYRPPPSSPQTPYSNSQNPQPPSSYRPQPSSPQTPYSNSQNLPPQSQKRPFVPLPRPPVIPTKPPSKQSYNINHSLDDTKKDNNNYIYLDQEDVERLEFDFDLSDNDYKIMPFEYKPVDYNNYDMDEYGNLDFTDPENSPSTSSLATITTTTTKKPDINPENNVVNNKIPRRRRKRRKRRKKRPGYPKRQVLSHRYGVSYGAPVRVRRVRPFRRFRPRHRILQGQVMWKPRRNQISRKAFEEARESYNYLKNLDSSFDFNSLVALAGLAVLWNTVFVSIVPNSFLLDAVNNLNQGKRSARALNSDQDELDKIVQMLEKM